MILYRSIFHGICVNHAHIVNKVKNSTDVVFIEEKVLCMKIKIYYESRSYTCTMTNTHVKFISNGFNSGLKTVL